MNGINNLAARPKRGARHLADLQKRHYLITVFLTEMSEQKNWWYKKGENKIGPLTPLELKDLASRGEITTDTMVWKVGLPNWLKASGVNGLFDLDRLQAPTPSASPAPQVPQVPQAPHVPRAPSQAPAVSATAQSPMILNGEPLKTYTADPSFRTKRLSADNNALYKTIACFFALVGIIFVAYGYVTRHANSEAPVTEEVSQSESDTGSDSSAPTNYPPSVEVTEAPLAPPAPEIYSDPIAKFLSARYERKTVGNQECWIALYEDESYCMKVISLNKRTLNDGVLNYLMLGSVDSAVSPSCHGCPGLIAVYIFTDDVDQKVVAENATILNGSWGNAREDWQFREVGPQQLYGWVGSNGFYNRGYGRSWLVVLAPTGNQIVDVADGICESESNEGACADGCPEGSIEVDAAFEFDISGDSAPLYPITAKVTLKRSLDKSTEVKEFRITHDSNRKRYIVPEEYSYWCDPG